MLKKEKMKLLLICFAKDFKCFLDEMVILDKSTWKYKQDKPNKPSKNHIKVWSLCDSPTGYRYNAAKCIDTKTSYS